MSDIFDQLADAPIPPAPDHFDRQVHVRLNKRLVAGQVVDLALRAVPYAIFHFGRAFVGLILFTLFGRFTRGPEDGPRRAPGLRPKN